MLCSDYRGLKKCITAIRREKDTDGAPASPRLSLQEVTTQTSREGDLQPSPSPVPPSINEDGDPCDEPEFRSTSPTIQPPPPVAKRGRTRLSHELEARRGIPTSGHSSQFRVGSSTGLERSPSPHLSHRSVRVVENSKPNSSNAPHRHAATLNMGMLPRFRRRSTSGTQPSLRKNSKGLWELTRGLNGGWDLNKSIPLDELLPHLSKLQRDFFDKLDAELDKIEVFYAEREKDMKAK